MSLSQVNERLSDGERDARHVPVGEFLASKHRWSRAASVLKLDDGKPCRFGEETKRVLLDPRQNVGPLLRDVLEKHFARFGQGVVEEGQDGNTARLHHPRALAGVAKYFLVP